jgi:hypothetical protein
MEDAGFTGANIYASRGHFGHFSQCKNEFGISQNRQYSRWNSQTPHPPPLFHDSMNHVIGGESWMFV